MKCQICFENYNHSLNKPYVLIPCTHTICIRCLDDLMDEPKLCPVCTLTIKDRNPNWALLDLIPESNTDRLKHSLLKKLSETEDSKKKINNLNKQKFKEGLTSLKTVKKELTAHTNKLVEILLLNHDKLLNQVKQIETDLESQRFQTFKLDLNIDNKIKDTRKKLARNQLKETQINVLQNYYTKVNDDLIMKLNNKTETNPFYEFISNSTFIFTKELIGKISNRQGLINDHHIIYHNNGIQLIEDKQYELALECLNKGLTIDPLCSICYNSKGLALHALKNFNEAVNCFSKSIEINPDNIDVFSNKGNALKELKDYSGAIRCFSKGLKSKI